MTLVIFNHAYLFVILPTEYCNICDVYIIFINKCSSYKIFRKLSTNIFSLQVVYCICSKSAQVQYIVIFFHLIIMCFHYF